jgi:signal transduction histidine kinase
MLLGTVIAWVVGNLLYASTLERRLTDQLGHAAGVLADGTFPLTPALLSRLSRLLRADIALISAGGDVDFATGGSRERFVAALSRTGSVESATDRPSDAVVEGAGYVGVLHRLSGERDSRYRAIVLISDLSDIRRASRESALWLGLAALAGVLGLTWIAHRIGLTITEPIQDLSRMADAIARGDREVRVPVRRGDEIGRLAGSLNAMAERLARYEQELVKHNRLAALGNMAARIAHEIRNPLTAIKLQIQLLAEDLPADRGAAVAGLEDEIDRLELIVSGVLGQAQTGPVTLNRRSVDPSRMIEETTRLFRPQFSHRGIALDSRLAPDPPRVSLDPDRFKQVLMNLLVNARDALPDGGRVLVTCIHDRDSGHLLVTVEDSGPGIAPEQQAQVLSGGGSDKPQGLGLGLRLSRELVEAHGGELRLDRGPLGGLRATIRLTPESAA